MSTTDWRRDRKSRKRRFDDDQPQEGGWSPPAEMAPRPTQRPREASAAAGGPEVVVVVERFDAARGFGFVSPESGGADTFIHISAIQRAGAEALTPGTRLRVRIGQGAKGPQVTEVLEVGVTGSAQAPSAITSGTGQPADNLGELRGTVRWYSAEKGFGFISPNDGGRDVFVHASALKRGGLTLLAGGQAVAFRVVPGKRGPEAESVILA